MPTRDWSDPPHQKVYAQTNEEAVLRNLDEAFVAVRPVSRFIVDVGAGDGTKLSNSKLFMDLGWKAFRVDARFEDPSTSLVKFYVTRDNVAALFCGHNVPKSFRILTIDIDGIDLYVLDAILRAGYRPNIVCFEFNAARPPAGFDVVGYSETFWNKDDYYGASWGAFRYVLGMHGYTMVYQAHCLNGYAVDNALSPTEIDSPPAQVSYHAHNPDGVWVDARELFKAK